MKNKNYTFPNANQSVHNLYKTIWFLISCILPLLFVIALLSGTTKAQDTLTGAFEGRVYNKSNNTPVSNALVRFTNQTTNVPNAKRSDSEGRFYQGLLNPGIYIIEVTVDGYKPFRSVQELVATRQNTVQPVPIPLEPETTVATTTPTPSPEKSPDPITQQEEIRTDKDKSAAGGAGDARRDGAFTEKQVATLSLGNATIARTFDELALLLPGVSEPPQTIGNGTGPGVGAGVGSSGQFSVNGLRSRANNFTVDGSDNNDEDIGVRRQGFFTLIPQPIESIQEYTVITLLAPAQYGRNIGAQVNAISKSGGNDYHGAIYGFINTDKLNSRNFFDTTNGNAATPLRSGPTQNLPVLNCGALSVAACRTANPLLNVRNGSGDEDSFTLGQVGAVLSGPLVRNRMFFFLSFEELVQNATKEANFAVPTVEQRGLFNTGATGIFRDPIFNFNVQGYPTTIQGDAIFSLFPFPNNSTGIFRQNTFTQTLPSNANGEIFSAKIDGNFNIGGRVQTVTARYNFTEDGRDIPVTGEAIFSTIRPKIRTQNFSTFLNSEVTDTIFNQLRLSYGRTRLFFEEVRDSFLRPSVASPDEPFLLNAPFLINNTLPAALGVPNNTSVIYNTNGTVEDLSRFGSTFGRVGQIIIAGFSPVGVDVFNFPQRRANNTYQIADTMTWRIGSINFAFGADIRRTDLNSDLPRNSRTLLTFNSSPQRDFTTGAFTGNFIRPIDLAAAGVPTGSFLTLNTTRTSAISLRYYQLNFFEQAEWRVRPNFTLSFGLRYEYNTPPRELNRQIENTFSASLSNPNIVGLRTFLNGRTEIFDPDKNNFAPRAGFAYSPEWFGSERATVIRAGYGVFYDQALGAVVSQSRNVFPNFVTVNTGAFREDPAGYLPNEFFLALFNPNVGGILFPPPRGFVPLVQPGTLNTINPALTFDQVLNIFGGGTFFQTPYGATLPSREFEMPMAHHYSVTFEQQLNQDITASAAYVGTIGRKLLRFTTPNLGMNNIVSLRDLLVDNFVPAIVGQAYAPGFTRPVSGIGPVGIYETTAESRYDAFQFQLRGRFTNALQYQANYTFSNAEDDVSDVFDLAGSSALPQNSRTFDGEYAFANFDARHRFAYSAIYNFPEFNDRSKAFRFFFGGLQIASSGRFQTGQPFTVNSIFDVNLDGNLTDRLNTTSGIRVTGNREQPLELTTSNTRSLLASLGRDGSVGRNTFRASNLLTFDVSFNKDFRVTENQRVRFRMDIFNLTNRANFGIPVRFLEAPGFGRATDTVTPGRRVQFALKYLF